MPPEAAGSVPSWLEPSGEFWGVQHCEELGSGYHLAPCVMQVGGWREEEEGSGMGRPGDGSVAAARQGGMGQSFCVASCPAACKVA